MKSFVTIVSFQYLSLKVFQTSSSFYLCHPYLSHASIYQQVILIINKSVCDILGYCRWKLIKLLILTFELKISFACNLFDWHHLNIQALAPLVTKSGSDYYCLY